MTTSVSRRFSEPSRAVRLLRAAAFAGALIPLSSIPAEATTIPPTIDKKCATGTPGCFLEFEGSAFNKRTWAFYETAAFTDPYFYTLTIEGFANTTFKLEVEDQVISQALFLTQTGKTCIPTKDESSCGLFHVREFGGTTVDFNAAGFLLTITWYTNDNPLSGSLLTPSNTTILKAPYTTGLTTNYHDPPTGTEKGLSGEDTELGSYAPALSVPESGSTLFLGMMTALLFVVAASKTDR
jgi:hypothetical protein